VRRDDVAPRPGVRVQYRPSRWQVGDVLAIDLPSTVNEKVSKVTPDGTLEMVRNTTQVTTASWMEKCLEVDGEGNRTKLLVYIRDWLRKTGELEDDSLRGAYVEVSGRGLARGWSLSNEGEGTERSAGARKWLEEHFGPNQGDDDELRRILLPEKPVAVGESWTPDLSALLQRLKASDLIVDREKMTVTAKLVDLEDGVAHCRLEASLPLSRPPKAGKSGARWTRGGVVTVHDEWTVPTEGRLLIESTFDRHVTLEGEATANDETMRADFRIEETRKTTVGGEFPEPGK
jgi:hypothetical protein